MFSIWTLVRFAHVLAAVLWVGGQLSLSLVVRPAAASTLDDSTRSAFFIRVGRIFGRLSSFVLFPVLLGTGLGLIYQPWSGHRSLGSGQLWADSHREDRARLRELWPCRGPWRHVRPRHPRDCPDPGNHWRGGLSDGRPPRYGPGPLTPINPGDTNLRNRGPKPEHHRGRHSPPEESQLTGWRAKPAIRFEGSTSVGPFRRRTRRLRRTARGPGSVAQPWLQPGRQSL